MAIPWICVPIPKSQVICRKQKKRFFAFFVVPLEIFSSACQLDNIDASRLHDSSFENLCPKVSKTHVEVFDTFKILSPIPLRSQKIQICVPQKIVFGQFFVVEEIHVLTHYDQMTPTPFHMINMVGKLWISEASRNLVELSRTLV